eukprot:TRINITY_DN378267_c0_g1_i1.p1 TRINITY_DN378267_c0_g1~~TRINITY_DN378267_c0_g1_i1.p1  ORF type:complete len:841 (+),score=238.25 TRINITY_DN378267_c0_g1_i1:47-2569(+)
MITKEFLWILPLLIAIFAKLYFFDGIFDSISETSPKSNSPSSLNQFKLWLVSNGAEFEKVKVVETEQMGNGVVSTAKIFEDEPMISVPLRNVICRSTILEENPEFGGLNIDDGDLVALFLIKEREKGTASRFYEYINLLPSSVPLPAFFNTEEMDAIQSNYHKRKAENNLQQMEARYSHIMNAVINKLGSEAKGVTKELFFWANSLIGSRALTLESKKYLVPLADMFNYEPNPLEREFASGDQFGRHHFVKDGRFVITADRTWEAGVSVLEDYGDNPNEIYFHHHAFVPNSNPFSCSRMILPSVGSLYPNGKHSQIRKKLAKRFDVNKLKAVCMPSKAKSIQSLPQNVKLFLLIRWANPRTVMTYCADALLSNKDSLWRSCLGEVQPHMLTDLLQSADWTLKQYPTSIVEDEIELKKENLTDNMQLAIRFRLSAKHDLQTLIQAWSPIVPSTFQLPKVPTLSSKRYSSVSAFEEAQTLSLEDRLDFFEKFIEENHFTDEGISPILVEGMRIGVIAKHNLKRGQYYLGVPDDVIFSIDKATSKVITGIFEKLGIKNAFPKLTLFLLYEYFVNDQSVFKPYLEIIPSPFEMEGTLFYEEDDYNMLEGSVIQDNMRIYQKSVKRDFEAFKKRILSEVPDIFPKEIVTWENFAWANAILDSRSIWWNGKRHLVPLLDLVNCSQAPQGGNIHSTVLNAKETHAMTKAGWDFISGEQLFEDYGQPNHIYFIYHGFSLEENNSDCVLVDIGANKEALCVYTSKPYPLEIHDFFSKTEWIDLLEKKLQSYSHSVEIIDNELVDWEGKKAAAAKFVRTEQVLLKRILDELTVDVIEKNSENEMGSNNEL